MRLGSDVVEKYSWGIDLFTFRNLMEFMPSNLDESTKSNFIEKTLIKELSNNVILFNLGD